MAFGRVKSASCETSPKARMHAKGACCAERGWFHFHLQASVCWEAGWQLEDGRLERSELKPGAQGVKCSIVSNRRLVKARYYCTLPLENINEDGQRVGDQGFVPLASISTHRVRSSDFFVMHDASHRSWKRPGLRAGLKLAKP